MIYKHYKGGIYTRLFTAKMSEDHETEVVVYVSLTHGGIWVRPLKSAPGVDAWNDTVMGADGKDVPRFAPVED